MLSAANLPTVNAILNAISAVFLIAGFACIRRRRVFPHKACMLAAVGTSVLFLISYLTYHYNAGTKSFGGTGFIRPVYFTILISHTVLAAVVVPLVLLTLYRAMREQFTKHLRIARYTLPIWLYVSITGVIVYLMLYHLYGTL